MFAETQLWKLNGVLGELHPVVFRTGRYRWPALNPIYCRDDRCLAQRRVAERLDSARP
jgi:hypothetical protein